MELIDFLNKYNLKTSDDGKGIWMIFANRSIYLEDGEEIQIGSFRYMAAAIAEVCGGDYLDYYCCYADEDVIQKVWDKIKTVVHFDEDESDNVYWSP